MASLFTFVDLPKKQGNPTLTNFQKFTIQTNISNFLYKLNQLDNSDVPKSDISILEEMLKICEDCLFSTFDNYIGEGEVDDLAIYTTQLFVFPQLAAINNLRDTINQILIAIKYEGNLEEALNAGEDIRSNYNLATEYANVSANGIAFVLFSKLNLQIQSEPDLIEIDNLQTEKSAYKSRYEEIFKIFHSAIVRVLTTLVAKKES